MEYNIFLFILLGFAGQMIDGCLGMAYGVSCTTFLLSIGIPPSVASASVHTAEIFTTAASGISHFKFGNVDRVIFPKLLIPGVIGGVAGAYILTELPGQKIKPFVSIYLLVMGLVILRKIFTKTRPKEPRTKLVPLGLFGGFFDAIGGGGWGPIVTTTLVARGNSPRFAIGSVNSAEFFVTIAESATFFIFIGDVLARHWDKIVGLLIGGIIAAPLAAFLTKRIPARAMMALVGLLIVLLSLRTIYQAWS